MQKINSDTSLREAIILLEAGRSLREVQLREQLRLTYESIKPMNLIKSTYEEVVSSQDLKDSLINTSVGLTAGYVSRALYESTSHSPLRKLIGAALLFGITNAVRHNPAAVKTFAKGVFGLIRSRSIPSQTDTERKHDRNFSSVHPSI
jgi:hypothetical protein